MSAGWNWTFPARGEAGGAASRVKGQGGAPGAAAAPARLRRLAPRRRAALSERGGPVGLAAGSFSPGPRMCGQPLDTASPRYRAGKAATGGRLHFPLIPWFSGVTPPLTAPHPPPGSPDHGENEAVGRGCGAVCGESRLWRAGLSPGRTPPSGWPRPASGGVRRYPRGRAHSRCAAPPRRPRRQSAPGPIRSGDRDDGTDARARRAAC